MRCTVERNSVQNCPVYSKGSEGLERHQVKRILNFTLRRKKELRKVIRRKTCVNFHLKTITSWKDKVLN